MDQKIVSVCKRVFILINIFFLNNDAFGACIDSMNLKSMISIEISYVGAHDNDKLGLFFVNKFYSQETQRREKFWEIPDSNRVYRFDIPVNENCGYFELYTNRSKLFPEDSLRKISNIFFWEVGDHIKLKLFNEETATGIHSSYEFSGDGAAKYRLRNMLMYEKSPGNQNQAASSDKIYLNADLKRALIMDSLKKSVSKISYDVLKADMIFSRAESQYVLLYDTVKRVRGKKFESVGFNVEDLSTVSQEAITKSYFALSFYYKKYLYDSFIVNGRFDLKWAYDQMKQINNPVLRDEVLVYCLNQGKQDNSRDSLINDAANNIKDACSLSELIFLKSIGKNKSIYSYQLEDLSGAKISLQNLRGKTIVFDFWTVGCGPCQKLFEEVLSKAHKGLKHRKDILFISISGDNNRKRWANAIRSSLYTSLEEINLFSAKGYKDAIFNDFNITKFPTILIIGKRGNIVYYDSQELYRLKSFLAIVASL